MKHVSTTWLLALLLCGCFSVSGQTTGQALSRFDHRIIPPSPEATQLGVFGSAPPDLNTGAMQTTIPLLEVKGRQLNLPISLNYHFTGLQVNEVAPWVGLGWTLSAGGVITRTVQGVPDEQDHGYLDPVNWAFLSPLRAILPVGGDVPLVLDAQGAAGANNAALRNAADQVVQGQWDSEPDTYNVSTPFYSGKLYIDHTGSITCSPRADVRISGTPGGFWTITTGDGTRYIYSQTETAQVADALGAPLVPTAWYLSTVISADGTDLMDFEYAANTSPNPVPAAAIMRQSYAANATNYTECNSTNAVWKALPDILLSSAPSENISSTIPYLKAIRTATMEVLFRSDSLRTDIAPVLDRPARRLTRIISRDLLTNQIKKQYNLAYTYFGTSPNADERRLRLDAVQEVGKPSYVFTYNSTQPMPSRNRFPRDHWGYYNGRVGNTTLMPTFPPALAATYNNYLGANRTPNGQAAMLGALQRVQYPTGGATQYDYEPNSAPVDCNDLNNQFGGVSLGTGGTMIVTAAAYGGASFYAQMDPFEQDYSRIHAAVSGSVDGNDNGRGPQNVDAALIDAPHGFSLLNLEYDGQITKRTTNGSSSVGCVLPHPNIGAYLYQVDTTASFPGYVALVAQPICKVDYLPVSQPNSTPPSCTTTIIGGNCNAQLNRTFPPGKYYVIAELNSVEGFDMFVQIRATVNLNSAPGNGSTSPCAQQQEVGGIRLARTLDMTGTGDTLIKTYRYRLAAADGGGSSGYVFSKPKYFYSRPCNGLVVGATDLGKTNWLDAGYHVGYSRVEVESRGKQAGTTVYSYLNNSSYGVNCRNLVMQVEEQDKDGGLVKRTTNSYGFVTINSSPGFHLTKEYDEMERLPGGVGVKREFFWLENRTSASFWPQLLRTTEETFGTGTATTASKRDTTGYSYLAYNPEKTTQPVRVVKYLDRRQQLITATRYCGQYSVGSTSPVGAPAVGLSGLVQHHMISVPVEHQTWLRTGADSVLLSSDLTHFTPLGRPTRVFALAIAKPLAGTDFISSNIGTQDHAFHQDPHYIERVSFPLYSPYGNLRQQRVAQSLPSSYLWGYEETKPIAEVQNAPYAAVAFTSFEEESAGRFSYNPAANQHRVPGGRTGRWAYRLNGSWGVRSDSLAAGDYELLFWAQAAARPAVYHNGTIVAEQRVAQAPNGWYQYRLRLRYATSGYVNIDATATAPILLDEVRLHPVGARMSSYTYDPLVGMTSQTDASGRTITYEYDAVGRLVRTRDEQGRLLSQQEYHYARP